MARGARRECRLAIGPVVIELRWPTAELTASMARYFRCRGATEAPTITLSIEVEPTQGRTELPNSLFTTKIVAGDGFAAGDGLVRGEFDPRSRAGRLEIDEILLAGRCRRVLEQIFYQAFYSACAAGGFDAVLLHASSAVRDGAGFVFTGRSGSGKSTAVKLSRGYDVLNDEISCLSFENGGIELRGTPFNGYFRAKVPGGAPLRAILLLAHGPAHRVVPVSRREAVQAVLQEIVPPMGLESAFTHATRAAMLAHADRIVQRVPLRRLEFLPDPGFWDELEREFPAIVEVDHA